MRRSALKSFFGRDPPSFGASAGSEVLLALSSDSKKYTFGFNTASARKAEEETA